MSLPALWGHQERELAKHYDDPARGLLWSMRSGKSRTIIETASRLYKEGRITGLLITAPNGVHAQWVTRQIPEWATCNIGAVLAWRSKDTKPKHVEGFLLGNGGGLKVLTLNVEALQLKRVQSMVREFLKQHGGGSKLMVVFDESHDFRRPGARRTRLARGLAKRCAFRRILTGTAALNSPLHLFSQFELLMPCALGHRTFTSFKAHHADYAQQTLANGRTFPKLTGYRNLEELRNWVGLWASVVPRSQADVPDVLKTERLVTLSQPQKRAYEDLKRDMLSVLDEGGTAHDIEPHIMKGQQIFGGFIHTGEGVIHSIDDSPPRLAALVEEVQGSEGKVIVWCRFREDIRRCVEALTNAGVMVVEYHGGVNTAGRDHAINTFQNFDGPVCFVGQPQSAGQGLDLSAGSTIIWYSHVHDAIVREQATARASVKGGEAVVLVDIIAEGTFDDRRMLNELMKKANLSDELAGEGLAALLSME